MDKLFDSLNSDTVDLRRGKPFLTNLKDTSPHLVFINEMKTFLQSLKFKGSKSTLPSHIGWQWTLNGIQMSIKSLATRRLQQDPLENLFGCIRGNCGSNCNPTSGQFVAGLKTSILSNLSHIGGGNCELDSNEVIIGNFKLLLSNGTILKSYTEEAATSSSVWKLNDCDIHQEVLEESGELQACAYFCGFLIKNYKNACEKLHSVNY
ncbi:jg20103 [Pararge aegeria aegeria]|uniref:Jg20103 protein n=1 Tax=Pararge aegeria aegeria TaxID=348720 RepID=A0A8S4R0B0_9NEOP|nr:jg20103 [Pararge aegeria aegeria]